MKESKNIPELRFPGFDGEWIEKRLGNNCSKIGSGKTPSGGDAVYLEKGIPFIRSQNVADNQLKLDSTHISISTHEEMKNSVVVANDILLNITGGSIGRSCVVPSDFKEANVNQHVCIIRLKKDEPRFLQPLLSSWRGQKLIYQGQTGSGREGLNFESIKAFKVYFPSFSEQTHISSFLAAVDQRINLLTQQKEALEQYKKGLMQQLFSQQLRFKDENGNDFPDWEEKRLGEIGKTFNGLTGKSKEDFGKGKPYIQYKQIFDSSRINVAKCDYVKILPNEGQWKAQFGDVFFTTSSETPNEVGMSSVLLDQVEEMYLNSFCFGFRPNSFDVLLPEFAVFLFRNSHSRKKIMKLAQGSTRYNMSKQELMKIKFPIPCKAEQQKIAAFLSSIDVKIERVSQQIEQSKTWKKGLLQKMFV